MAPQENIPPVANVLSTIGTVFWCAQLFPQIWHNWRRKDTTGLPGSAMLMWSMCSVPFGAYDTTQRFAIPLIIQPQIFGTLALIVWAQCMYYGSGWSLKRTTVIGGAMWLVFGGIEALLILTLRPVVDRGLEWPIQIIGAIATALLVGGFIPMIWEIIHRRGRVVGINWIFLLVDWLGAFFSLLGVVTQDTFDILGGVLYIACGVIELGIFASHGIWLLRTWKLHRQAKSLGVDFDNLPEARRYQWKEKEAACGDEESQVSDDNDGNDSNKAQCFKQVEADVEAKAGLETMADSETETKPDTKPDESGVQTQPQRVNNETEESKEVKVAKEAGDKEEQST